MGEENAAVTHIAGKSTEVMFTNSALREEIKAEFVRALTEAAQAAFATYSHVPPDVQKQIGLTIADDRKNQLFDLLDTLTVSGSTSFLKWNVPDRDESW